MNFDERLRLQKGNIQYHLDKVKGGRSGSSAGRPRPKSRQNMMKARLYSPTIVGQSLTVTPQHNYLHFYPGNYYEWEVTEPALGHINGTLIEADEIKEHFIVIPKGRQR